MNAPTPAPKADTNKADKATPAPAKKAVAKKAPASKPAPKKESTPAPVKKATPAPKVEAAPKIKASEDALHQQWQSVKKSLVAAMSDCLYDSRRVQPDYSPNREQAKARVAAALKALEEFTESIRLK